MTCAILQPYFLPYIGYYQIVSSVDTLIYLDDVTYIKGGYINSNFILQNKKRQKFTLPLVKASSNKPINSLIVATETRDYKKLIKQLKFTYSSPKNSIVKGIIQILEQSASPSLVNIIHDINLIIFEFLGLKPKVIYSSVFESNQTSQERVIQLCQEVRASNYINPIGGIELYDKYYFAEHGINLKFHRKREIMPHESWDKLNFVDNLSIIDVLANFKRDEIKQYFIPEFDIQ